MKTALQTASAMVMCLALALSSALAAPSSAAAQAPAEDARALFARGQTAYRQGDYEAAIAAWSSAYTQDPRPLLQYNLAQAYERLGRLPEAKTALEQYVAAADANDPNQGDARARLSSLRERLARTGVTLTGGPEGATILIDGEDKGRTPRPDAISVSPGSHRVVVRRAGYADFNSTIVVPAGQAVEVAIEMTAVAGSGGDDGSGGGGGGGETQPAEGGSSLPTILLISGGGVAVVGLGIGAFALVAAGNAKTSEDGAANRARTLALVSDISLGLGVVTAAIGLVLMLTSGEEDTPPPSNTARLHFSPILAPTVAGASATLTF
jgi:hypothetical protein